LGSPWRLLASDAGALLGLSALALCIGLLLNGFRRDGLPLRYSSAEARLRTAVAGLAGGEQPGAPVDQIDLETFRGFVMKRSALILDARPDAFYRMGHVPGALNLARETFAADYAHLRVRLAAAKDDPIVVYCADADCPDSALVASALKQLGFRHVLEFAAGWEGWTAAGLPEEKQTPP
jgi:rhodanese-related sulfurtransferase